MTLTIDKQKITGHRIEIDRNGETKNPADKFSYSAKPIKLKNPKSVPTL
jgi:hypothetical protein